MPIPLHTALRGGAGHILAGVGGAIDLPRHVDCSEAVAAGPSATARDAIRGGVATREVPGKDAGPRPAGPPRLSRPNANCAIECACGATALAGYAPQPVRSAAQAAAPAVVRVRLNVRAGPVAVDLIRGAADPRRPAHGAVSVLAELAIRTRAPVGRFVDAVAAAVADVTRAARRPQRCVRLVTDRCPRRAAVCPRRAGRPAGGVRRAGRTPCAAGARSSRAAGAGASRAAGSAAAGAGLAAGAGQATRAAGAGRPARASARPDLAAAAGSASRAGRRDARRAALTAVPARPAAAGVRSAVTD